MSLRPTRSRLSLHPALACLLACSLLSGPLVATADSLRTDDAGPVSATPGGNEAARDSGITTRVRARLAARHFATLSTVKVSTGKDGIVWLSGTVTTLDASAMASQIAKDTDGVVAVHNAIVVQ